MYKKSARKNFFIITSFPGEERAFYSLDKKGQINKMPETDLLSSTRQKEENEFISYSYDENESSSDSSSLEFDHSYVPEQFSINALLNTKNNSFSALEFPNIPLTA